MSSDEKIMEEGGEGSSQDTPQAITITIMDPSALETTTLDSALVASVEAQDPRQGDGSLLVVPGDSNGSISVAHGAKNILQTVTETHLGAEDLPVISNINSSEDTSEQSTIHLVTKTNDGLGVKVDEVDECEISDFSGHQCLICDEELQDEQIPVFKTQTATSQRKVSVFLGVLVGQKITSRKAHSDIICQKCFGLLNKLDLLEVEIRSTKDEIVNKYQETVSVHGGRARRKKSAAAKKSEYVFPKIEPEDEDEQALALEMDETFEPHVDDLMEEEHDRREDRDSQDEEWEPEFKKARIKREPSDNDPNGPPKRKRGRPRKDASKPKETDKISPTKVTDGKRKSRGMGEDSEDTNRVWNEQGVKGELEIASPSDNKPQTSKMKPQHSSVLNGENIVSTTEALAIPANLHLDFESLKCFCGIQLNSEMEYLEHMLTHKKKWFKCPKCSCAFSSSSYLVRHQCLIHFGVDHSENTPLKETQKPDELSIKEENVCIYCNETERGDMVEHVKVHLLGENECPVCSSGFSTSQSMESHIAKEHSHLLQSFLKFEESLAERNVKRVDKTSSLEICDICGKVTATSSRMAQHRYLEHREHYPWTCSECTLAFQSPYDRDHHWCPEKTNRRTVKKREGGKRKLKAEKGLTVQKEQLGEEKNSPDSYTCPVCALTMTSQKALLDHVRSHKGKGDFECKFCGVRVKTSGSLKVHINEKHTRLEIHQCKVCPQVFFSAGRLSYHVRRHHTNRNTYTNLCHLCGKAYPYPNELRLHLRYHRNERPYKCDQCPKAFLKKGDLTYHKRSHTGERPHKCPHCESRFPRPNTLMSHIRQHHQENVCVSTTDAATTTSTNTNSTCKSQTTPKSTTVSTSDATTSTTSVAAALPNSTDSSTTVQQQEQQQRPTVATSENGSERSANPQGEGTPIMPVVEGQLVEAVVDGQVTEMQPVQYVQVDGLEAGQTVQAVQAVPHMVDGMEYYQIVHLQILK